MGIKKFIGNKKFYKMLLLIALPIVLQNSITNFVSLLDNIMVGQVGTEQMSGVAIANQLILVFNLCIFGGISGPGIFTSQFFGAGNHDGVRQTHRFKLYVSVIFCIIFIALFSTVDEQLISLYLHESDGTEDLAQTLIYSKQYLKVMIWGLVPFAISMSYAGTLRETGHTVLPMVAGVSAVVVNLVFNWLLIFGNLGFPKLGVEGAAIATVISRYVELVIILIWTHTHKEQLPYIRGIYKTLKIDKELTVKIIKKGTPLMLNEMLWSVGMTTIIQCYSMRGLTVIAAINISSTLSNLFNVVMMSMGNAVAIIVGNLLGAGKMKEAKETDTKIIATSFMLCIFIGAVLFLLAPLFPRLYNTNDSVRALAATFLRISACIMPIQAINHCCYYTLRSGGRTFITFLFDSAFVWVICVPPAYCIAHFTTLGIVALYTIVQLFEIIKSIGGITLVKKGIWLNNMVAENQSGPPV